MRERERVREGGKEREGEKERGKEREGEREGESGERERERERGRGRDGEDNSTRLTGLLPASLPRLYYTLTWTCRAAPGGSVLGCGVCVSLCINVCVCVSLCIFLVLVLVIRLRDYHESRFFSPG